jgi:hypothetical protein
MKRILYVIFCLHIILALACAKPPSGRGAGEIERSPSDVAAQFRVETVAANLQVPWAIAFAPVK